MAAVLAEGLSTIENAAQEPEVQDLANLLNAMGAKVEEHSDGLTIIGGKQLHGTHLDSETDHRVAMSLAIAALLANSDSTLARSNAAAVSYPDFWTELERLRS